MQLITMECPKCHASLEFNRARKEAFCEFCGAKILLDGIESVNQLGQPIADEALLELLKETGPLFSNKDAITFSLPQKEASLRQLKQKLDKLPPAVFRADYISKYLIAGIVSAVLFLLFLFIYPPVILLFMLTTGASVFLYKYTKDRMIAEETAAKTQTEIDNLKKALTEIDNNLSQYDINAIPSPYRNGMAIDFIYDVLKNQRATTMQQAINLYEEDKRNKKMESMQQQQMRIQEQQLRSIQALQRENAAIRAQLNSRRR